MVTSLINNTLVLNNKSFTARTGGALVSEGTLKLQPTSGSNTYSVNSTGLNIIVFDNTSKSSGADSKIQLSTGTWHWAQAYGRDNFYATHSSGVTSIRGEAACFGIAIRTS